jgi:signal transduction histidine kinase
MNKMSIKLGILFLVFILLIESMLFFFLYLFITSERVENETDNLLARGMTHRDVLEKSFDMTTIEHVALMETEADTMVVITDNQFNIIDNSNEVNPYMQKLIDRGKSMEFSHHGILVESRWRTEPYLATISPININGANQGYVYMFVSTEPIRKIIWNLTFLFIIVGVIAIIISIVTIFFLFHFITKPIITMKEATEQLSRGKNDVKLDLSRNDELGALAKSIQKLSDDLEHLKNDRNEFLSSISHELRTPLTYLKGYADVLKRSNISDIDKAKYVSIIQEEATKLTEFVKELFTLAKMDQNQFSIHKERVMLNDYLKEIVQWFIPAFKEKDMKLELQYSEQIYVMIDPIRFKQVISNLLDNSMKYSPSNTTVILSVMEQEESVMICVKDEGEGVPEQDIAYIWDRLYRVDKSRSRMLGGSGLGLTIVKEIVERHGGSVQVTSIVGKGTTISISLPKENN